MGDRRFAEPYRRLAEADDRPGELRRLRDEEIVQALAHTAETGDDLLANVLATEALNRMRRIRTAIAHMAEGLVVLDKNGTIVDANPSALKMVGYSRAELLGEPLHETLHFQDENGQLVAREQCPVMRALREGCGFALDGETFTRKDGSHLLVSGVYACHADDPRSPGGVLTFRDVTATRQRDRLARQLAAAVEATDDAMVIETPLGTVIHWNAAAERLFGYTAEEMVGLSIEIIMPPERASDIELTRRVGRGENLQNHETQRVRKDGTVIDVALTLSPIRDERGEVEGVAATYRDVTERHRQDAALRRSEQRYRTLVSETPMAVQTFDPQGNALEANDAWERLWGVPRKTLQGYNILEDPQVEALGHLPDIRRAFAGERVSLPVRRYDPRETGREGRARWVKSVLYPLRDPNGRLVEVVLIYADVTDDMEARERVRETDERYRLLVEGVRDYAMYTLDPEGRIMSWNPGAQQITGWAADEVIGRYVDIFLPEAARRAGEAQRLLRSALENGSHHEQAWRVRKNGTRFWADVLLTALRDEEGNVRGYAKITRDLEEQRRAQEALRESEERYRRLVERSPAPLAVHAEGELLFVNAAAARLMGAGSPEDLLGRNVLEFVHEKSRDLVVQRMQQVLVSDEPLPPAQHCLRRLDGELIEVEAVSFRMDYGGRPAVQVLLHDVSKQARLERQLRETAEELERRVRERTTQLQQALLDMETFTNSASHDLRAPLRGVDELSRALLEDYGDRIPEDARDLVDAVRRENQKAIRLVQALLAFARSGRGELRTEWVDVTRMARELAQDIRERHAERRTTWDVPEGMKAWADPGLLRIALANLMSNASKYSDRAAQPLVRIETEQKENEVVLRVQDNGVGFPQAEAYRLFGAFNRLSTASGFEGTGLGLVAVHRIASRHGGRVWAESAPGEGTTFSVALPAPAS